MKTIFGVVFLGCALVVECQGPPQSQACVGIKKPRPFCADTAIKSNLSDPFVIQGIQRDIAHQAWADRRMVQGSSLIAELKRILEKMLDSNSFMFTGLAFSQTVWAMNMLILPRLQYSLCDYAKAIDNDVEYTINNQRADYAVAAAAAASIMKDACPDLILATVERIPCPNRPQPVYPSSDCNEDGLVFRANEVWDLYGELLPRALYNIFWELYNSDVYVERANAVMLAFAMTPLQQDFLMHQPLDLALETLGICARAPITPKMCCGAIRERLTKNCEIHIVRAQEFADEVAASV